MTFETQSIFDTLDANARTLLAHLEDDRRRAARNNSSSASDTAQAATTFAARVLLMYAHDMNGLDFDQVAELMRLAYDGAEP